jgi:hypothetical protein
MLPQLFLVCMIINPLSMAPSAIGHETSVSSMHPCEYLLL